MPPKPVLGLVGGIASGKTTVGRLLARHGGHLVLADQITHRILDETDVRARLTGRWGKRVLGPDGRVDRARLADLAFESAESLAALNAIVHPPVLDEMRREVVAAQRRDEVRFVVIDAALLLEAGQRDLCDWIVFVDADLDRRTARVAGYRQWPQAELERREAYQKPLSVKRQMADHVVVNNGSLEDLEREVEALVQRMAGREPA